MATRNAPRAEAGSGLATIAPVDEMAGITLAQDADDGLGEASGEDLKIATKLWNMKGKGADGRQIPADVFYDTIDESSSEELDAVFLYLHKTNAYTVYDNAESKTKIVCRSDDRKTGTMEADGKKRPCEGCPDAQWYTEGGKRKKNCGPVYHVAALDRRSQQPFWLRFKRTSLPVIRQHLQRHHLGRRVVMDQGKLTRKNYPLYAFQVSLRCEMSKDGKYALPVLTRGTPLSQGEIDQCEQSAAAIRENLGVFLAQADAQVAGVESEVDTSFDPETFAGAGGPASTAGAGEDFVP